MAIAMGRSGPDPDAGGRAHGRGEVFSGLWGFVGAGVLLGLSLAPVIAGSRGSIGNLPAIAGQAAGLGAILGLFVGLGRGVWRPGPSVPAPAREQAPEAAPAPELWDPWLDHGRDPGPVEPVVIIDEPVAQVPATSPPEVSPPRAPVRPRVISPTTGEAIPLEDEIGPLLQEGRGGLFVILGGPGSGKTTALRHLAAIFPPWTVGRVRLLDVLDLAEIAVAGPDSLVVLALDSEKVSKPGYEGVVDGSTAQQMAAFAGLLARRRPPLYRLARWVEDDAIEYLLATDREACASVMRRLKAAGDFAFLDGNPELCAAVLDRMAREEEVGDARTALRRELADRIAWSPVGRERIADYCVDRFRNVAEADRSRIITELMAAGRAGEPAARLSRHRPSALLLAADRLASLIEQGRGGRFLTNHDSRELVREVARMIAGNEAALDNLERWVRGKRWTIHPMAASLLHAAKPGWRPGAGGRPCLEGAFLDGVRWPGQDLKAVNLRRAHLGEADLGGANLERALARRARLRGASLREAVLSYWNASRADLSRADLSRARGHRAQFHDEADLTGARLVGADLYQADFTGARIDDADFTGANLEDARLKGLPLCRARFEGARFGGADLRGCDMEGMVLNSADFHDARLEKAMLTGSRMPDANFRGADLRCAGLAEIDWPGACLCDADLRGANFHLGSTRSGLVDSQIACEGSRTGFYTDDDIDREIRPAEGIRKANLRGADLRGADIRNVDFYLVDLRDARYNEEQAGHFRRCRAILGDGPA